MEHEIKTMNLYKSATRIYRELEKIGYSRSDKLHVSDVSKFDQLHFFGVDAVKDATEPLQVSEKSHILEIGSGLGGPARVLADLTNCRVDALELQKDHHEIARDLTNRCGLADRVRHIHGDVLESTIEEKYDGIVSWLVFLHIPDKHQLFKRCYDLLLDDGIIYIEDFFERHPFSGQDQKLLRERVFAEKLSTTEDYVSALQNAGFTDIKFHDETRAFVKFANDRVQSYEQTRQEQTSLHGDTIYEEQLLFQRSIADLFNNGSLGGCKIIARKN